MKSFSQLISILAKNLDSLDREELRLICEEIDNNRMIVTAWQQGNGVINAGEVRGKRVFAGGEQLSGMAGRFNEHTQNLATATNGYAEFTADYNDGYGLDDFVAGAGGGYREIVIPETGKYLLGYSVLWEANVTGNRLSAIYVNGVLGSDSLMQDRRAAVAGGTTMLNCVNEDDYEKGDKLKLWCYQTSGATIYFVARLFIRKVR